MIENTSHNNNYSILPNSGSECLTNKPPVVNNKAEQRRYSERLVRKDADRPDDRYPLAKRQCVGLGQTTDPGNASYRLRWGGKGMYLAVLRDFGLMVPLFRCIEARVWQRLETVSMDLSPLLSALDDGHEFAHNKGTLAMLREWLGGVDQQKQRRWLEATYCFVASDECYQQLRCQPVVAEIGKIQQAMVNVLDADAALIVRSSGIGEDSLGNARAGKYDSLVHDGGDILKTYLKVVASSYRPGVFTADAQPMAVIVQHCISCRFSGVAMSYRRCDDNTLVVEYGPGQGRGVVSGQGAITPHRYERSRAGQTVFSPGNAAHGFFLKRNDDGRCIEELAAADHGSVELDDVQLKTLHRGVERLENRLMCPVDVEFAIDHKGELWFLQVRPVTALAGGSSFAIASAVNILDQGAVVSEGAGSGMALAVSGDETTIPENSVLFADHGREWMLRADVLARLRGVVFKRGGRNDHIAITLRQAGLPCMLVNQPQWWPGAVPEPVTLVCGRFQKQDGGFILAGDLQQELLNSGDGAKRNFQAAMACTAAWQPPIAPDNLSRVDHLFQWLVQSNERLLDFMGPERLMYLCLSNRGAVQLSMHLQRAEIIDHCAREIRHFLVEAEAFFAGYKHLLMLGTGCDVGRYGEYRDELDPLGKLLATIRQSVEASLATFTWPFSNSAELPHPTCNLHHWLHSCQLLSRRLLWQVTLKRCESMHSVHQLVLWLHQRFLAMIAPVASASGQGTVQARLLCDKRQIEFVDFAPAPAQQLLNTACYQALMAMDVSRVKVLIMPDYVQLAIELQCHACTLEMLTQAEGGRGRTLRLRYSEYTESRYNQNGKWLRLWFLAQTLAQSPSATGLGKPDIVCNDQIDQILFEFARIPSREAMQRLFADILKLLGSIANFDLQVNKAHLDGSQTVWNMNAIRERLANPAFAEVNLFALAHGYWLRGANQNSLINPFTQSKALVHRQLEARIFHDASPDLIDQLLSAQRDTDRRTVLWHFFLADPDRAAAPVRKWTSWLSDEATATRLVSQNGHILKYLAPPLSNQKAVVLAAIKSHPEALAHASADFKNDVGIVSLALRNCTHGEDVLEHIGPELTGDPVIFRQLATLAVTCDPSCVRYLAEVPVQERDQPLLRELYLTAQRSYGQSFWVLNNDVLQDLALYRQMVIEFLQMGHPYSEILKKMSEFQNDREVVELSINCNPHNFRHASVALRQDKALARQAVAKNGLMLEHASDDLRDDAELVSIAVKNDGWALKHASDRLRRHPDIITAALQNAGSALKYAPECIRCDTRFAYLAVSHQKPARTREINSYLPSLFYGDKELMMMAVKLNHNNFSLVDSALQDDEELVHMVLKYHGIQLRHASTRLRADREVVSLAVASSGEALRHASPPLRADRDVVALALHNDGMALRHVDKSLKACVEIVAIAVKQNGLALQFAPASLRRDKSLVTLALENNGEALRFVDADLWDDPEIIAAAEQSIGPVAVEYIRLDLKECGRVALTV